MVKQTGRRKGKRERIGCKVEHNKQAGCGDTLERVMFRASLG